MLAEIVDLEDREVEIKLQDEDISVMHIVQHELLKEKNVEFAGVVLKHPLIEDFLIRVITKKKDPIDAFQYACATASHNIKNLNTVLKEALSK
jgi:DNA-directed RNA polymerase subunit L